MNLLDTPALDMHIGLANCEWVNIVRIKVAKTVVDEAVCSFVRPNGIQDVLYCCVLGKAPVIFGNRGCRHLRPGPATLV
jgi:hypothetical protein